jgi:uncharacterized membrane protein YqaE (UPF0057 family)
MLYLVAIFIPPLAVLLAGKPGQAFLNLLLTLLFYFTVLIHAFAIIADSNAQKRTNQVVNVIQSYVQK